MARKQLHDFNLRAQPGTEFVWTFDTTWGAEHFEAGSVVPPHIAVKVHKMKDLFHRKRVQLWRGDADGAPVSDETPENTPENGGEVADQPPKPYKSGPGWWRIEGVDEAFRTEDEAQAAWDLKDAIGS